MVIVLWPGRALGIPLTNDGQAECAMRTIGAATTTTSGIPAWFARWEPEWKNNCQ